MYFFWIATVSFFKLLQVLIISSVKFILAPFISLGYGFSFVQTIIYTTIGGILGILFFFYLSKWIIKLYYKYCPVIVTYFTGKQKESRIHKCSVRKIKRKKIFNWRNKFLIKIKHKYGFIGIIVLTPIVFSIPLGAFLANKYYSNKKNLLL